MDKWVGIVAMLVFAILVIIFAPLATISAINTIFGTGIQYTFWTWLSALWLQWLFVVPKIDLASKH